MIKFLKDRPKKHTNVTYGVKNLMELQPNIMNDIQPENIYNTLVEFRTGSILDSLKFKNARRIWYFSLVRYTLYA